jgi:hypothetical protein
MSRKKSLGLRVFGDTSACRGQVKRGAAHRTWRVEPRRARTYVSIGSRNLRGSARENDGKCPGSPSKFGRVSVFLPYLPVVLPYLRFFYLISLFSTLSFGFPAFPRPIPGTVSVTCREQAGNRPGHVWGCRWLATKNTLPIRSHVGSCRRDVL